MYRYTSKFLIFTRANVGIEKAKRLSISHYNPFFPIFPLIIINHLLNLSKRIPPTHIMIIKCRYSKTSLHIEEVLI